MFFVLLAVHGRVKTCIIIQTMNAGCILKHGKMKRLMQKSDLNSLAKLRKLSKFNQFFLTLFAIARDSIESNQRLYLR